MASAAAKTQGKRTFCDYANAFVRKERMSPSNKTREASRNKFVEERAVRRLGKIISAKDRQKTRLEFLKTIRNRLKEITNLVKNRPTRMETDLARKENGVRLKK